MLNFVDRVTIFAVGVSQYKDSSFENLQGPEQDIENLRDLLIENKKTALYSENQFKSFFNPTKTELEAAINEYVRTRSASEDILLFYFSGHGIPIGRNDFGLCLKDSESLENNQPLPLSILKYKDLLNTLDIKNIIPIVIIDACYSGVAGTSHQLTPIDAMSILRDSTHSKFGTKYSLLCSCSGEEYTLDSNDGGIFTKHLINSAKEGIKRERGQKPIQFITIQKLYKYLNDNLLTDFYGEKPRLFIGSTMPEFPFVKNTKYKLKTYNLSPHLVKVLKLLWNNGEYIEILPSEITKHLSTGSYGNHKKLSLAPWNLVVTILGSGKRKLNNRGKRFMEGKLKVPFSIIEHPTDEIYETKEGTRFTKISDYVL